jgi:hypothetical protein
MKIRFEQAWRWLKLPVSESQNRADRQERRKNHRVKRPSPVERQDWMQPCMRRIQDLEWFGDFPRIPSGTSLPLICAASDDDLISEVNARVSVKSHQSRVQ